MGFLWRLLLFFDAIRLWDLSGPVIHGQLEPFPLGRVNRLYLAPDYQTIAVIGDHIRLWDIRAKTSEEKIRSDAYYETLFSPDGRLFASAIKEGVQIWSVDTETTVRVLPQDYFSHSKFTFSLKGDLLTQAIWEESLCDLESWSGSEDKSDEPTSSRHSHLEGKKYLIQIWERSSNQMRPVLKGPGDKITSLAFSPDSKFLAIATSSERSLSIWNLISQDIKIRLPISLPDIASENRRLDIENDSISDFDISHIVWSPDKRHLASICKGGTVLLWDTATWTLTSSNEGDSYGGSAAIAFSRMTNYWLTHRAMKPT
ncbi:quinon protein alcohol dehydrogenase-like superfamily [Aspergillus filifer]